MKNIVHLLSFEIIKDKIIAIPNRAPDQYLNFKSELHLVCRFDK